MNFIKIAMDVLEKNKEIHQTKKNNIRIQPTKIQE